MNNNFKHFINAYLVILILSTVLFCYKVSIFNVSFPIDYAKFDSFGSFISGTVSALTVFLVYKTFQEQVNQIKLSKQIQEIDIINRLYSEIIDEINGLEYKQYKGLNALYNFDDKHRINPNSIMNHLLLIFVLFENTICMISQSNYIEESKKHNELEKIYLLFYSKLIWPIYENIYNKLYEDSEDVNNLRINKGLKRHSDSEIVFGKYKELTANSYSFLLTHNLVTLPTTKPKMISIINRDSDSKE